jgi:hypothetical protein
MRKIYFAPDRTWVGEVWVGRHPKDATHEADIPPVTDPRWIQGKPSILDTSVLTLSPFYPSGRLDACVEYKESNPISQYPNHPPFAGVVAWMHLDALRETATLVPNEESRPRMRA